MEVLNGVKCITFGLSGAEYVLLKTFYVLSRFLSKLFKKHIYIISRFSRGSRRATGTHGSLLGKRKQGKLRQFLLNFSRGQHFTATGWSVGRPDQKKTEFITDSSSRL